MILRETSFERFIFTCSGCDHVWDADYDVQHVEDGHGHERDYFFRHQLHCPDPTGLGETTCPHCGRASVRTHHGDLRTSAAVKGMIPAKTGPTAILTRTITPVLPDQADLLYHRDTVPA